MIHRNIRPDFENEPLVRLSQTGFKRVRRHVLREDEAQAEPAPSGGSAMIWPGCNI